MSSVVKTAKTVEEAVNQALSELNCSLDDVKVEVLEEPKSGLFGIIGSRDAVVRITEKQELSPSEKMWEENETQTFVDDLDQAREDVARNEAAGEDMKLIFHEKGESNDSFSQEYSTLSHVDEKSEEPSLIIPEQHSIHHNEHENVDEADVVKKEELETNNTQEFEVEEDSFENVEELAQHWLETVLNEMHIDAEVQVLRNDDLLKVYIENISESDMGIVIGRRAETLNALQYLMNIAVNHNTKNYYHVFLDVGGYRERRKTGIEKMAKRTAEKVQRYHRPISLEPMNSYERRIVHFALQNVEGITTVSEGRDPFRKVVIKPE